MNKPNKTLKPIFIFHQIFLRNNSYSWTDPTKTLKPIFNFDQIFSKTAAKHELTRKRGKNSSIDTGTRKYSPRKESNSSISVAEDTAVFLTRRRKPNKNLNDIFKFLMGWALILGEILNDIFLHRLYTIGRRPRRASCSTRRHGSEIGDGRGVKWRGLWDRSSAAGIGVPRRGSNNIHWLCSPFLLLRNGEQSFQ